MGICRKQLTSLVECRSFVQNINSFCKPEGGALPSISHFIVWSILLFFKFQMCALRVVVDNLFSSLKLDIFDYRGV